MVLCLLLTFLAVNFDWSIILIRKSFGASRHISEKLGVKLAMGADKIQKSDSEVHLGVDRNHAGTVDISARV